MHIPSLIPFLVLGSTAASVVKRQYDNDFSGSGNILVLSGKNIAKADTSDISGCIADSGSLVTDLTKCGVFTLGDPQVSETFSSSARQCNFADPTTVPGGYALKCNSTMQKGGYWYSLDGYDPGPGLAFIWTGNLNPYYEATSLPAVGEEAPIWPYLGGPDPPTDRMYFMWLWKKLSD